MTEEECEADDQRRQRERFRPVRHAGRRSGHITVVMTCTGREALFERTWASLDLGSAHRTYSVKDLHNAGQAPTFFHALELAASQPDFEHVTLFEDDVIGARRACLYIAHTEIPDDVAMVSWFHRLAPNPLQSNTTWMIERAADFSHQQAVTLPAATVRALLASEQRRLWSTKHGADMLIGEVMPDAKVAYHFPNIVDHVGGDASLTGNNGPRRSATFVGEDFDAYDLTR